MNSNLLARRTKNRIATLCAIAALCWVPAGLARDQVQDFPLNKALSSSDAKAKLGDSIKFAFGSASIGTVAKNHGEFRTNKKTNAFGKSDEKACNWAFLSAMITLKDRAVTEGGNAVINIRSNYKNNPTSSETTFQCGAGNVVAGVALIGDVVTIN
jgi:uncharacterized protein YbjQ (UPF0145 family)